MLASEHVLDEDYDAKRPDHLDETGRLKPSSKYKAGEFDYFYETDDLGRIKSVEAENLQLTERSKRLRHESNTPEKLKGDDAGHLIADRFGGSPKTDNLVSQLRGKNRGEYRKIEDEWAAAVKDGKKVTVRIEINYPDDGLRPQEIRLKYTVDGEYFVKAIPN
ncbi:MAG: hypothetical protein F9K24_22525 [Leptonema illini]|uniref:Type VII secretion system protein EssD-like domain-containing protein n=1 Tax=Leptonema illini TaxID=183 RepID=A0A833LUZ6_9LEPT|nr:MAG: hypothetical protein F9K24_22525 [Leptonema illini]